MLLGVILLAGFALVGWLLVEFIKSLYAGRPVDRIWVILGAYAAGCIGAAAVVVPALFITRAGSIQGVLPGALVAAILFPLMIPFVTGFIAAYALLPAAPIIICAELTKIRSPLFYGPAGVAAAALTYAVFDVSELVPVPAGAVGGLGGGLTYWRFAGRSAGQASAAAVIRSDEEPPAVLP